MTRLPATTAGTFRPSNSPEMRFHTRLFFHMRSISDYCIGDRAYRYVKQLIYDLQRRKLSSKFVRSRGRSLENMKKDQLCHREEFRVRVVDMLHVVPLLYSFIERSLQSYKTSGRQQFTASFENFKCF